MKFPFNFETFTKFSNNDGVVPKTVKGSRYKVEKDKETGKLIFTPEDVTINVGTPGKLTKRGQIILSINFAVILNGFVMGFQSVSEMGENRDFEYINEGGRNDYPIKLRMPQRTPHKLVFKRGLNMNSRGYADFMNPLVSLMRCSTWAIERGGLGMILVLDRYQEIKAIYGFISQGMSEWTVSDLDAERSSPLVESFTITHRGLHSIPVIDF